MRFDLKDLQLVVAVCDSGAITRGADRVAMTLASASERIRGMEQTLGADLFIRHPRGVTPTEAGAVLLRHARRVLAQVERMRIDLARFGGGLVSRLRVHANTAALAELVPARLSAFLQVHPGTDVDIVEQASADIVAALRQRQCDIGIVSDAVDVTGLASTALRADPLELVLPAAHPLAGHRRLPPEALPATGFIGLVESSALQRHIARHARVGGRPLGYRTRVASLDAVCRMVGEGLGPAIVPRATAVRCRRRDGFVRVALEAPWTQRRLLLVTRAGDALPLHGDALLRALAGR